jgi:MYXO-CTERM domain-containing protein
MRQRYAIALAFAGALISKSAFGAIYTYNISGIDLGSDSVAGFIQTYCNNCRLSINDIVNWDITVKVGSELGELRGPLTAGFSQEACDTTQCIAFPDFGSVDFAARPTGLYFNFYDEGGYMWFRNVGIRSDLPGTQLTFCSLGCAPGIEWQAGPIGADRILFPSTDLVAVAVPEPSVWTIMLVGLGGLGAAVRTRRRTGLTPMGPY